MPGSSSFCPCILTGVPYTSTMSLLSAQPTRLHDAFAAAAPTNSPDGRPVLSTVPKASLSADEADRLLAHLVASPWQRLSSEYDDPLGMLFSNRIRQWTAGWAPDDAGTLYLLVWEAPSWQEKALWSLYANGKLLYQEQHGLCKSRSQWCQKLLESEQLPFARMDALLAPLIHHQYPAEQREHAVRALLETMTARPEIVEPFKEALLQALEADLGNPNWPLLEVMKIHRLKHKTPLVWLFRQLVETGMLRAEADTQRLNQALARLQNDYSQFGRQVPPLFRPAFDAAHNAFCHQLQDGVWRVQRRRLASTP